MLKGGRRRKCSNAFPAVQYRYRPRKEHILAEYIIYTDGGCERNPGGRGGYGIVMVNATTGEVSEYSEGFLSTTNNRMEVMAVLRALEMVPEGSSIRLYSDSQYTLNCLTGAWRINTNFDLWRAVNSAKKGKDIETRWVRGHNGDQTNERCDELATLAMSSIPLSLDHGYEGGMPHTGSKSTETQKNGHAGKRGAMGVEISLPDGLPVHPGKDAEYTRELCEKGSINKSCNQAIRAFSKEDRHLFKSYAALKTGGRDSISSTSPDALKKAVPEGDAVYAAIADNLSDPKDAMTAMRWYVRGLSAEDAIRKVLVDKEISENAVKAGYR